MLIWNNPVDQGGVAANTHANNFSGWKMIQTFVPNTAAGKLASRSSQCNLIFTWTAVPACLMFSATTLPGKTYQYSVAATNQFTATVATVPTKKTGTYSRAHHNSAGQRAHIFFFLLHRDGDWGVQGAYPCLSKKKAH